jgi:signal transduction histidine kinase
VGRPRLRLPPAGLVVASGLLVALPWLAWRVLVEMRGAALEAQERALAATARAAAVALADGPFERLSAGAAPERALRLLDLPGPVVVDGLTGDWTDPAAEAQVLPDPDEGTDGAATARYRVGRQGNGVYALFEVRDDVVLLRGEAGGGDRVEIGTVTGDDEFLRFEVDAAADGPASAWLVREDGTRNLDNRVEGAWATAEGGWVLEIRLPRTLVGPRLGFAVVDVDDPQAREVTARLEAGGTARRETLRTVRTPEPGIDALLAGLAGESRRVFVIDDNKHVLAQAGAVHPDPARHTTLDRLLRPSPSEDPKGAAAATDALHEADLALAGAPATRRRTLAPSGVVVLSAAHPVRAEGRVRGAVLAQEAAAGAFGPGGPDLATALAAFLAACLAGVLALLGLGARLSFRVRRLRDAVEDLGGDTRAPAAAVPEAAAGDAVGDLARSVAGLAARQREHAAYLEQVGRRLSHEMRTPVGVVRSSLDNLRLVALPGDARVYLDRADEGLRRLSLILSRMSEATRLEQSLAATERETYDLVPVVRGCVEAYRGANPGREIALREPGEALRVVGSPDLLAQLLDKLVDNALGFALPGTPVEVDVHRYGRAAAVSVRNEGPRLPAEMEGRLFESMVSIRPSGPGGGPPHLGLGLYVVRLIAEFHGGSAAAHDRPDGRGVIATVTLPLAVTAGP